MFGSIGVPELIMIFVVALLLFGPRKLPDIGRSLGKALGEFRRASNDLKRTLEDEVAADQLRDVEKDVRTALYTPPGIGGQEGRAAAEPPPRVEQAAGSDRTAGPEQPAQPPATAEDASGGGEASGGEPVEPH